MTIAVVHEIFLPVINGVVQSSINTAKNLEKKGHRIIFFAPRWKAWSTPHIEGVPVYYLPSLPTGIYPGLRFALPTRRIAAILKHEQVDVVHLTGQGSISHQALRATRRLKIPVVHTLHTLIFEPEYLRYALLWEHRLFRRLPAGLSSALTSRCIPFLQQIAWHRIRRFVNSSTITTTPSKYAAKTLTAHCPKAKVEVLPNNLVAARDMPLQRETPYQKTFIYVGRIGAEKSMDVLLKGFKLALRSDNELKLLIAGDGPHRSFYQEYVKSNHLQGSVQFLGWIEPAKLLSSRFYTQVRALVTASTTENQPMSLLEAIARGIPVIAPDSPAINELLVDNNTSFPPGDTNALAKILLRIANNEEFYQHCAAAAQKARETINQENITDLYEDLYFRLI